jgi:hypothetical protein
MPRPPSPARPEGPEGRFDILPSSRVARNHRLGPPGRRHAAQAGVEVMDVVRVKRSLGVVFVCILSAALAACGGKPKERPAATEVGGKAAAPAADMKAVPGAPYVLTQTLQTPLNNQSLSLGFSFDTGSNTPVVTHLGRWKVSGNSQTHDLSLYKYVNGKSDVQVATVSVDLSTGSVGTYVYAVLGSPVTLLASTRYYVISQEASGGDTWYNHVNTTLDSFTPGVGTVYGSVISGSPGQSTVGETGSTTFGPVNIWVRPH